MDGENQKDVRRGDLTVGCFTTCFSGRTQTAELSYERGKRVKVLSPVTHMSPKSGHDLKFHACLPTVQCFLVWTTSNFSTVLWKCIHVTMFRAAPWTLSCPPFTVEAGCYLNIIAVLLILVRPLPFQHPKYLR